MKEPHSILISFGCCGKAAPCSFLCGSVSVWFAVSVPCHARAIVPALRFPWMVPGCNHFPVKASSLTCSLSHLRGGFNLPGILGKRAKSSFLVPYCVLWAASHPSQSPKPCHLCCLPPCLTTGIASRRLHSEVPQFFPFSPKMCCIHLAVKTWI